MSKTKKPKVSKQENLNRLGKFITMVQNDSVKEVISLLSKKKKPLTNQDILTGINGEVTVAAVNKSLIRLREFGMINVDNTEKRRYLYSLSDSAKEKIASVEAVSALV